ncbi:macrophage mannose receptor 1-like [Mytilus edulis]|uniref:macrophage mannose receptor 1-like n=1 Tax=Mytilus edulis TaxID=6550 RepID=UPI0039EE8A25
MNLHFCFVITSLFMLVRIEGHKINGTKFAIESGKRVVYSAYTTDQFVETKGTCAMMCTLDEKCCAACYNDETSICRLDTSEHCCVDIEVVNGWEVFKRESPCTVCTSYGCINYNNGSSFYKIIEEYKQWEDAKISCACLGGKLLEAETPEENNFIKTELRTRATGVQSYWIGGYNFKMNGNFEWISNQDQPMTYSDFGIKDYPNIQRCLLYWKDYGYAWGDGTCTRPSHYVCEFFKQ